MPQDSLRNISMLSHFKNEQLINPCFRNQEKMKSEWKKATNKAWEWRRVETYTVNIYVQTGLLKTIRGITFLIIDVMERYARHKAAAAEEETSWAEENIWQPE